MGDIYASSALIQITGTPLQARVLCHGYIQLHCLGYGWVVHPQHLRLGHVEKHAPLGSALRHTTHTAAQQHTEHIGCSAMATAGGCPAMATQASNQRRHCRCQTMETASKQAPMCISWVFPSPAKQVCFGTPGTALMYVPCTSYSVPDIQCRIYSESGLGLHAATTRGTHSASGSQAWHAGMQHSGYGRSLPRRTQYSSSFSWQFSRLLSGSQVLFSGPALSHFIK